MDAVKEASICSGLLIVTLISFWTQAVVTEERFVPWLDQLAKHWKIPKDVAGATLMAAGASMPELLASFLSTFLTHSSIGLGTIIGSEIFNQLCCTAGAILAAKDFTLKLSPAVVIREVFFYGMSLVVLLIAIIDRRLADDDVDDVNHLFISTLDGCLLIFGYFVYVLFCLFWDKINYDFTLCCFKEQQEERGSEPSYFFMYYPDLDRVISIVPNIFMFRESNIFASTEKRPDFNIEANDDQIKKTEETKKHSFLDSPIDATLTEKLIHYFLYPMKFLIHYTIAEVEHDIERSSSCTRIAVSSTSCLIWLTLSSYVMVSCLEHIGYRMNVPDAVIGITVSAAGTSLPIYVASQVAAREGFGNMAVANVLGANTFNILFGLGLPWTIYTMIYGTYHELRDEKITESVIILAGSLLLFVLLVIPTKFVLYRWHAIIFFAIYIVYIFSVVSQVYVGVRLDNKSYDEDHENDDV